MNQWLLLIQRICAERPRGDKLMNTNAANWRNKSTFAAGYACQCTGMSHSLQFRQHNSQRDLLWILTTYQFLLYHDQLSVWLGFDCCNDMLFINIFRDIYELNVSAGKGIYQCICVIRLCDRYIGSTYKYDVSAGRGSKAYISNGGFEGVVCFSLIFHRPKQ